MISSRKIASHVAVLGLSLLSLTVLAEPQACPPQRAFKLSAIEDPDVSRPYTEGMLWKVELPGAAASYLFGTIHLPLTRLPPAVALALVTADNFVAETVLDQPAVAYYQRHMISQTAPNLGSLYERDPRFRARLLDLLSNYGFDRRTALRLEPWAGFTVLSRPKPTGAPTLDQLLESIARQRGIPVRGLQSVAELVATLESIPVNAQREIVRDTVCNRALIQKQAQELTARYLDQDLAGMLTVSSRYEPHNPAVARIFRERLLDARSAHMLKRMQPYLKQGNAFVAVGALHLAGRNGLLQGLASQGYRINAVYY